ncbi:MAG: HD-GYP domain-containing protein (c-di-GMP phosphodiesterase class II) [Bacteriovoracaceae bacterium]|jgi:HD-GYP domain-containing protein (c-di-GMP phosphodiesterase class II)
MSIEFYGPYSALEQNALGLKLTPISIRELLFITEAPCEVFGIKDGLYKKIIGKSTAVSNNTVKELLQKGQHYLFVYRAERHLLIEHQQDNLRQVTRSLSVGDPVEKAVKQMNLLTINLGYLYANPTNDELLDLQFQSAKNLANFLIDKSELHEQVFQEYLKQKHHFILAQPALSSLFLMGILKNANLYNNSEIINLFLTSYFKDIGMSAIPTEKYDQEELSENEKVLLAKHAHLSVEILQGRTSLGPSYLKIIENHHSFSLLTQNLELNLNSDDNVLAGFETMLVTVMDVISAMISGRPYRKASSLYESLDLIKLLIADQYPQEFKLIVTYFRSFFFNGRKGEIF